MLKCDKCKKNVTKKSPGLQCGKCELAVHATNECSGLSNKQLTALRASENLEWTCDTCQLSTSRRSYVTPDEDDDDASTSGTPLAERHPSIDIKKLLQDLYKEINKTIKKELSPIQQAIQFCSDKVDDFVEGMEVMSEKMKNIEKQTTAIKNHNVYLETKIQALEQRVQEMEQGKMLKCVEVAGIPDEDGEDLSKIVEQLAAKLKTDSKEIHSIQRLHSRKGVPRPILIKMKSKAARAQWSAAARAAKGTITVGDVVQSAAAAGQATETVYVREALTAYNKALFWKTKTDLKDIYKYVWCSEGRILARKCDNDKVVVIRSETDILKLTE